jgi:Tfp pilus assembly protein PilX
MQRSKRTTKCRQHGSALVLSIMFLAVFSALAVAMATISGTNVQMAENHRKADATRACADSGLEVVRYWMSRVAISGTTAADQRFAQIGASLTSALTDAGVTNFNTVSTESTITVSEVSLDSNRGQSFSALLTKIDNDHVQLDVTGHYGPLQKTIRSNYLFGTRANTVFDFGVASKGPVSLSGNVELEGVTIDVESNAYIESENSLLALSITGNSHIAGHVKIVNPLAYIDLQGGKAGIGGVTGDEAAQEPYTTIGVAPADFPVMSPSQFAGLVTLTELDPSTDTTADATLENIIIPANMNPTFSGHATLKGLVWVETPNVVTFTGGADVTAIIIGNGDPEDDSATNRLDFKGNVDGEDIASLPADETQFDGLRDSAGTFIMAPGFHVSFGGSFDALCGAIAANGIEFYGNAGGQIQGSIVNYSDNAMMLSGNSDLYFNRSGIDEVPAGFVPEIILEYDASSYSEMI